MSIEPKEMSAHDLAAIANMYEDYYRVRLLAHIEHQSRQLIEAHAIATTLRGELAEAQEHASLFKMNELEALEQRDSLRAERDTLARNNETISACLDHWQARFSVLREAWRTGDNSTVLDAVRLFVNANDSAPAGAMLQTMDTLARRVEELQGLLLDEMREHQLGAGKRIDALTAENGRLRQALKKVRDATEEPDDGKVSIDEIFLVVDAALAGGGESAKIGETHGCDECGLIHDRHGNVPRWTQEDIDAANKKSEELRQFFDTKPVAGVEGLSNSDSNSAAPSEVAESKRRTLFGLEALTGGEWLESQPPTRHLDEEGARTLAMKSTYLDGRERRIVRVDEVRTVLADTARITKELNRE